MEKLTNLNYRNTVININSEIKKDLRDPKKILKLTIVYCWNIINDNNNNSAVVAAAKEMKDVAKKYQKDNKLFSRFCENVRKTKKGTTCIYWTLQYLHKNSNV